MSNRKKEKNKTPLLTAGIVMAALGLMSEAYVLLPIGIFLIVLHVLLKKKSTAKKPPQSRQYAQQEQPIFKKTTSVIEFDAETRRAGKRKEADHSVRSAQYTSVAHTPHVQYGDMMRQAQAEIRNLKNIRYARSELTGRTLSDTVIWHSRKGVCSSVVQVIRQGNLRYPDLSDRELSERILADNDLMASLAQSLEWEKRTEIRWN